MTKQAPAEARSHREKLPEVVIDKGQAILTGRGAESSSDLLGDFPVEYCNDENPDSVGQLAPDYFVRALDLDEVWTLLKHNDEFELAKKVKPSAEQNRLRLSFWREYERAIQMNDTMLMENIYKGIVAKEAFINICESKPRVMAWILKQPTNYVNMMEEALNFSMHRVREILEMPIYKMETRSVPTPSGRTKEMQKRVPNVPVAKLILDTMKLLDVRVKGAIVQRVQQEVKSTSNSSHVNVNVNGGSADRPKSLEEINEQIRRLTGGK